MTLWSFEMKKLLGLFISTFLLSSWVQAQESTELQPEDGLGEGLVVITPEVTEFDDWNYVCVKDDDGNDFCQAQHIILNQRGGRMATIEVFRLPEGSSFAAGAAIATPLGVNLSKKIELQIEGAPSRLYDYSICVSDGCLARIGLTQLALERLIAGSQSSIKVFVGLTGEREIKLEFPSNGFAESYAKLEKESVFTEDDLNLNVAEGEIIREPDIEVFDDWSSICFITETGEKECQIRQISLNEFGTPLATINIFKVADNERFPAGAEILVPHGVSVQSGLELQVDGSLPRRYEFSTCLQNGCFSRIGLTESDLERFRSGEELKLVFYVGLSGVSEELVEINSSLNGFMLAYNSLL